MFETCTASGTPCVVQHENNFYRGLIKESCGDGQLLIQYVDYGTDMRIHIQAVSDISDEFLITPTFAILSSFLAFKGHNIWDPVYKFFKILF